MGHLFSVSITYVPYHNLPSEKFHLHSEIESKLSQLNDKSLTVTEVVFFPLPHPDTSTNIKILNTYSILVIMCIFKNM